MRRTMMGLGTLTAFALWPIHASATYITGSYAGTVRTALSIQQEDGPPLESIEYGPISGTFGFETDIRTLQEPPDRDPDFGDGYAIYYRLPMRMEFNSSRFNDVFDNDTDAFGGPRLEARQENGQQHLVLDISGPYWYADISFAGLLFDSLNPLTFDPRFIDVAGSTARFSGDIRYVANSIEFGSIVFDGKDPQSVPEPETGVLLLIGASAMLLSRRRRLCAEDTTR